MSGTDTEWVCKACGCTEAECDCEDGDDFDDVTGCEDFDEIDPGDVFDIEYDR